MKLAVCNHCSEILFDENPTDESFDFPDSITKKHIIKKMVMCKDKTGKFWGCPNCNTDAYLSDVLLEEQL